MPPRHDRSRSPFPAVFAWGLSLSLAVIGVSWVGSEPSMAEPLHIEESLTPEERITVDSVRSVFAATLSQREEAFALVDSLTDGEKRKLRRSLNASHVRAARHLGVTPIPTDSALGFATGLGGLDAESPYYTTRWGRGRLAPDALAGLDAIGERFHQRLAAAGLPTVRFVVSSTFRTAEHQDRLRGSNPNAARGRSSHEYGTTFDIAYRRYQPVLEVPGLEAVPADMSTLKRLWLASELDATERAWADRVSVEYAGLLEAELGRALIELESEGVLLALREVRQPCFHVTVARRFTAS